MAKGKFFKVSYKTLEKEEVKKYCYMWREGGQFSTEKYNSKSDLDTV